MTSALSLCFRPVIAVTIKPSSAGRAGASARTVPGWCGLHLNALWAVGDTGTHTCFCHFGGCATRAHTHTHHTLQDTPAFPPQRVERAGRCARRTHTHTHTHVHAHGHTHAHASAAYSCFKNTRQRQSACSLNAWGRGIYSACLPRCRRFWWWARTSTSWTPVCAGWPAGPPARSPGWCCSSGPTRSWA